LKVSALGFGASSLGGGVFRPVEEPEAIRAVHTALDLGINIIDVPVLRIYPRRNGPGQSSERNSSRPYYLATKVGRYGDEEFDFSAKRVTASIDESLARMASNT